ncbi:MAG: DUF4190 domain-containing protein [Acidimicrobiales bacterium]
MTDLPTTATPHLAAPSAHQTPRGRKKAGGMATASLVLSIVWMGGLGSIVAIAFGVICLKKTKGTDGVKNGADSAIAGIVIGVVGLILAIILWTGLLAGGNGANMTSSPSYVDGSSYATSHYANNVAEPTVCTSSNVSSGDRVALWMRGCQDGWATARFAINSGPGAGLNVSN